MPIIPIGPLCVPAEFLKTNNARKESYPFDWARSNILSVIDVIKNGHDYHCNTNIRNVGMVKYKKHFSYIFYPHHCYDEQKDYMVRCSKRFFEKLNDKQKITFLYMSNFDMKIGKKELKKLIKVLENNYDVDFEIVMIYYIGEGTSIYHKKSGHRYKIFYCESPMQFYLNPMRPHKFYTKIFNIVFPNFFREAL